MFIDKEEEIPRMCQECCELHVRCVCERGRSFVGCGDSQDVVTATADALGVPELDNETSTKMDGHLITVLSSRAVRTSTL